MIDASPLLVLTRVASVSERHFVVVDENQEPLIVMPDGQPPHTSFGGMSGSPVYAIPPNGVKPTVAWLAGFVYEEGPGHSLMVAHADHIDADGTIR